MSWDRRGIKKPNTNYPIEQAGSSMLGYNPLKHVSCVSITGSFITLGYYQVTRLFLASQEEYKKIALWK